MLITLAMLTEIAKNLAWIAVEIFAGEAYTQFKDAERGSLRKAYEQAFLAMLQQIDRDMVAAGDPSPADMDDVVAVMKEYCAQSAVQHALLEMARRDQPPDMERMFVPYRTVGGPVKLKNIHFDLRAALTTFQVALKKAVEADSNLAAWLSTGALRDIQQQQRRSDIKFDAKLDAMHDDLRSLKPTGAETIVESAPIPATPPRPPRTFTGRQPYIDEIKAKLTAGERTVIAALQGMGGIGKTALAQQLAAELKEHYPGGIFWGPLGETSGSPERILRAWAAHCGADLGHEQDVVALTGLVRGLLTRRVAADGPMAAIIDDVRKEWLDGALRLLEALPEGAVVLLTTRNEQLAGSFDAEVVRLDLLPVDEARELLQKHAGAAVLAGDDATVERLLYVLGLLPLAVKLAGGYLARVARKPGFSLVEFADRVATEAAALLDAKGADESSAQRGLTATFNISYAALDADHQQLYRRLSVYSSPLLTVEHIAALVPEKETGVEEMLDSLVHAALLEWDAKTPGLYTLHPLLRQYGYARLAADEGDVRPTHKLAAEHLQNVADARPRSSDEGLGEVDQWEQAEEWRIFAERASALVGSLDRLGYWREIDLRLEQASVAIDTLGDVDILSAHVLTAQATIAFLSARWPKALDLWKQSLAIWNRLGDTRHAAVDLGNLGNVYLNIGVWRQAVNCFQQSLKIFKQSGDIHGIARTQTGLGNIYHFRGMWEPAIEHYHRSIQYYQQCLQLDKQSADIHGMAQTYNNLGTVFRNKGDLTRAIKLFHKSLEMYKQVGDFQGVAQVLGNLGSTYEKRIEWEQAIQYHDESLAIFEELDDIHGMAITMSNMGNVYQFRGEWKRSIEYYERSLLIFEEVGDNYGLAKTMGNLGNLYQVQGDTIQATHYIAQAYLTFARLGAAEVQQAAQQLIGLFGSAKAANDYLRQFADQQGQPLDEGLLLPEEQGVTLDQLSDQITQACGGDAQVGEQLYKYLQGQSADPGQPQDVRALARVLTRILIGIRDPDLSQLPDELKGWVQDLLARLAVE